MKSLTRRFTNVADKNPYWSSYICFANAVKEQGFTKQAISRWFNRLVEKDDYAKGDKKALLAHLGTLSNAVRTTRIDPKNSRGAI